MKIKIEDKNRIKKCGEEVKRAYKKYNIFPTIDFNIAEKKTEYNFWEADKLTKEEKQSMY